LELQNYIKTLWRRKIIVLAMTVGAVAVAAIGTHYMTPVYRTSTVLRIAVSAGGSLTSADYMYTDRLMNTYVQIATSPPVTAELVERLGLPETPILEARIVPSTELIEITVEDVDPRRAALVANTLADILIAQEDQLYTGGGKTSSEVLGEQLTLSKAELEETRQEYESLLLATPAVPEKVEAAGQLFQLTQNRYASLLNQYEQARFREEIRASMITVFQTAAIPEKASRPRVAPNLALGLLAGLIGGLGLAFLVENLDNTLYEIETIENAAKMRALVKIPKANRQVRNTFEGDYSPFAEAFRNLATNLQLAIHQQSKKVLLLVSAEPNQGKSMITFHLACSLAELGKTVVAVDCDTRLPRLHSYFQLPNRLGLKDVLEQQASLEDTLQQSAIDGVHVLTSGSPLAHPSQVLNSTQMAKLLRSLSQQFDFVLLDSPALLSVADVAALTPHAGGLMLIVRLGHAERKAVEAAGNFLTGQDGKYTWLIVNQVQYSHNDYYYKHRKKLDVLAVAAKQIFRHRNNAS
jgi:non-specific protein-tyrosine kinase